MPIREIRSTHSISISHKTQRSLTERRDLELPPSAPRDLRPEAEMLTSRQRRLENRVADTPTGDCKMARKEGGDPLEGVKGKPAPT